MRILILADIHGNWPALQAIDEEFDVCLFLGDLVEYNLDPAPCIEWVREHADYCVRGNHDHGVAQNVPVAARGGYKYLTSVTRTPTLDRIDEKQRRFLASMPISQAVTIDGSRFFLVHASPRDPMDEYNLATPEFWQKRIEGIEADVICVGHTHVPYVLEVDGKVIINPGSVGQPRDGDPRASYAIIEDKRIELRRAEYPIHETIEMINASEVPDPAKKMLATVLSLGTLPRPSSNGRNGQKTKSGLAKPQPSPAEVQAE